MTAPVSACRGDMNIGRRSVLGAAVAAGAAAWVAPAGSADAPAVRKGRIRQSLVNWCYRPHWENIDEFCQVAVQLGCQSIELGDPQDWPTLRRHGLTCAIAGSHGFKVGYNNPGEWAE